MSSNSILIKETDVIIAGAGISGLTAAYNLLRKDPSLRVIVLEAKDHVGGRTLTVPVKVSSEHTDQFDLGGQWVCSAQPHILQLLKELNLETYPQHDIGYKIGQLRNADFEIYKSSFPTFIPYYSRFELDCFIRKVSRQNTDVLLKKMSKEVSLYNPFNCTFAKDIDSMTVETMLLSHLSTQAAQDVVRTLIRISFGMEASQLSALFFLAFINGTDGFLNQFSSSINGAWELKIKGGSQQIAQILSTKIGSDYIILNSPVSEIEQLENRVQVITRYGHVYRSEYIILALPPSEVQRILFNPPLPAKHTQVLKHYAAGHLTKFVITYSKAFWKEKGFSGEILSYGGDKIIEGCDGGPITAVFDATTANGHPAIAGYISSRTNVQWSSKNASQRKECVLKTLSKFWGVYEPIDYVEKNWGEEDYVGGCPTYGGTPGGLTWFHHIRMPFGRIYWAGTETSTQWCGYMEGAVQAGERVAIELLYELRPQTVTAHDLEIIEYESLRRSKASAVSLPHVYRWTLILPLFLIGIGWAAYALRRHFWVVGVGRIA